MKKGIVALLMIAAMAISLSACGSTETSNESIIEEEQEEIVEEEPEQGELEEEEPKEEPKEEPEEDKPLDIEANLKLKYIMEILAATADVNYTHEFDYDLSFLKDLYALEDHVIMGLLYDIHSEYGEPEGGRTEYDSVLFSVKQVETIIGSLVGHEVDLSSLANNNGWIETALRTDVLYTECKNWNTEYIGNNTWKVYADVYSFNIICEDLYQIAEIVFTVTENADSILDGYSIIEVEATPPKMSEWAKAYYDYLTENHYKSKDFEYYPIYLDNDDIPEIYVYDGSRNGDSILCYSAGQINEEVLAVNYTYYYYIPQSGLLMEVQELLDIFGFESCSVYQFVNGEFSNIIIGGKELKEEYKDEFIKENWMLDYEINDEPVSEEEYNRILNEIFDTSKAIGLRDDKNNVFELCPLLNMLSSH